MARSVFGTNSATPNTAPTGIKQGTPGGKWFPAGGRPGKKIQMGDELYLWILVLLEVLTMSGLRHVMRRYHGG